MATALDAQRRISNGLALGACASEGIVRRERFERHAPACEPTEPDRATSRVLTHELNNLLCVISGYADIALLQDDAPLRSRELLLRIKEASERAAIVTRRLRAVPDSAGLDGDRAPRARS